MKTNIKELNELLNEISSNQEKINWLISIIEHKDNQMWDLKIDLEVAKNQIQKLNK